MLKNGRQKCWNLSYDGCSCHNSKQGRRNVKKTAKRRETREAFKREQY